MITVELLQEMNACTNQLSIFQKLFPNGVVVTEDLCAQHAQDFDWDGVAEFLLSELGTAEYDDNTAQYVRAYEKEIRPYVGPYNEAVRANLDKYERAITPHRENYALTYDMTAILNATQLLLDEYTRAIQPINESFQNSCAPFQSLLNWHKGREFAELYIKENP